MIGNCDCASIQLSINVAKSKAAQDRVICPWPGQIFHKTFVPNRLAINYKLEKSSNHELIIAETDKFFNAPGKRNNGG